MVKTSKTSKKRKVTFNDVLRTWNLSRSKELNFLIWMVWLFKHAFIFWSDVRYDQSKFAAFGSASFETEAWARDTCACALCYALMVNASTWDDTVPNLQTLSGLITVILKDKWMFKYTIWLRKVSSFDLNSFQLRSISMKVTFLFVEIFENLSTDSYFVLFRGFQWYLTIQHRNKWYHTVLMRSIVVTL